MARWNWTRISAAATLAVAGVMGSGWAADMLVAPRYPTGIAYDVPDVDAPDVDLASLQRSWPAGLSEPGGRPRLLGYMKRVEHGDVPMATAAVPAVARTEPKLDLATLLAHADIERGRRTARVCSSCHSFDPGGPDRIGPGLWGVVGRDVASRKGFAYSPAIAAQPGDWTYEQLDQYLANPARAIPGNKMAFAGIRRAEDRASLLAYLGSLNSKPAPFPKIATAQKTATATPGQ